MANKKGLRDPPTAKESTNLKPNTFLEIKTMTLRTKLANKPILDKEGYATGTLESITLIDASESDFDRSQFQFSFKVKGTRKDITLNLWSGTTISGEKYDNGSSIDYNKLSKIVMKLGLISEKDLIEAYQGGKDPELDLDSLIGVAVRLKLNKSAKKGKLSQIDLNSIELEKV